MSVGPQSQGCALQRVGSQKNVFKSKNVFACLAFLITVSQPVLYQYGGFHQYGEAGGPLPRGVHT